MLPQGKKLRRTRIFLRGAKKSLFFLHNVRLFFNKLDNKRNLNNFDIDINN